VKSNTIGNRNTSLRWIGRHLAPEKAICSYSLNVPLLVHSFTLVVSAVPIVERCLFTDQCETDVVRARLIRCENLVSTGSPGGRIQDIPVVVSTVVVSEVLLSRVWTCSQNPDPSSSSRHALGATTVVAVLWGIGYTRSSGPPSAGNVSTRVCMAAIGTVSSSSVRVAVMTQVLLGLISSGTSNSSPSHATTNVATSVATMRVMHRRNLSLRENRLEPCPSSRAEGGSCSNFIAELLLICEIARSSLGQAADWLVVVVQVLALQVAVSNTCS
jgi:hypothetical protein